MKKLLYLLILILTFSNFLYAQNESATLRKYISDVSSDTLLHRIEQLSGEVPVIIDNEEVRINSRHAINKGNKDAEKLIKNILSGYGYEAYTHTRTLGNFQYGIDNVIAVKPGIRNPDKLVILCGHYDSTSDDTTRMLAPGADDNASGTAGVIEAARILQHHRFENTIIFALFDMEEVGLYGSALYSDTLKDNDADIIGVINMDMIGYDSDNDSKAILNYPDTLNIAQLAAMGMDLNQSLNIGLDLSSTNSRLGSDHLYFIYRGYRAIMLIESLDDFNICYHQTCDRADLINKDFIRKNTQLGSAMAASLAVPVDLLSAENGFDGDFDIAVSPNPATDHVTFSFALQDQSQVKLEIFDQLGNRIETFVDPAMPQGEHYKTFFTGNLAAGLYFYRITAGGDNFRTGKFMIVR